MQPEPWHFPMTCPSCGACSGTPYRATPEAETIRLDMRCADCLHTWEITGASASPLLSPKRDRRTAEIPNHITR